MLFLQTVNLTANPWPAYGQTRVRPKISELNAKNPTSQKRLMSLVELRLEGIHYACALAKGAHTRRLNRPSKRQAIYFGES